MICATIFMRKKSKDFNKDRKAIVACTPNKDKWIYYLVNIDLLSVDRINISDNAIKHPSIDDQ